MDFFKFPRTPHLFVLPNVSIRDDKVMSENEAVEFLEMPIIIEEKADGANLGISFHENEIKFQNRGNYVVPGSHPQFDPLWDWAYKRFDLFKKQLGSRYILFGEWCYLKHSIHYTQLPDWFLGFDIYDRQANLFLSVEKRNIFFTICQIEPIPHIYKGLIEKKALIDLLKTTSKLYSGPVEGLYLRHEAGAFLKQRAKIVRTDFIQEIEEHWSKGPLVKNLSPSNTIYNHPFKI